MLCAPGMGACCSRRAVSARGPDDFASKVVAWGDNNLAGERAVGPCYAFPMYVFQAKVFLQMAEAEAHQVLKRKGLVHVHRPSRTSGVVAFVSHQWLKSPFDPQVVSVWERVVLVQRARGSALPP